MRSSFYFVGLFIGFAAAGHAADSTDPSVEMSTQAAAEAVPAAAALPVIDSTATIPVDETIFSSAPKPAPRPAHSIPITPDRFPRTARVYTQGKPVRSLHLTAWIAGSAPNRARIEQVIAEREINSLTIAIKEFSGEVFIPGVKKAEAIGAYQPAMGDIEKWIARLKAKGVYTIARMVVFKDNVFPRKVPAAALKGRDGSIWIDRTNTTWFNPYSYEGWRYNLLIAVQAARLGFDEIQFDYIRFPTDGDLRTIDYGRPNSVASQSEALVNFLKDARQLLGPLGVKLSIDVFGLTTSDMSGMGIGQLIVPMASQVDYVCPMVYPSHYNPMEYGIPDPNREPFPIVYYAVRDAIRALGADQAHKLRPYLQDFSLGFRYGVREVQAQIQAVESHGIQSWTLWSPKSTYTIDALRQNVPKNRPDSQSTESSQNN